MKMCEKSDVVNHKVAFSDHVIQEVTISQHKNRASAMPYGYYGPDGTRDINSGWRIAGVNEHSAYWVRVITRYELTDWESE